MTTDDEHFLRRAIELATVGRAAGDAPFGSLLVDPDGAVLAEDHNTVLTDGDITAHPELKRASPSTATTADPPRRFARWPPATLPEAGFFRAARPAALVTAGLPSARRGA
jgi:hypothetical protein